MVLKEVKQVENIYSSLRTTLNLLFQGSHHCSHIHKEFVLSGRQSKKLSEMVTFFSQSHLLNLNLSSQRI